MPIYHLSKPTCTSTNPVCLSLQTSSTELYFQHIPFPLIFARYLPWLSPLHVLFLNNWACLVSSHYFYNNGVLPQEDRSHTTRCQLQSSGPRHQCRISRAASKLGEDIFLQEISHCAMGSRLRAEMDHWGCDCGLVSGNVVYSTGPGLFGRRRRLSSACRAVLLVAWYYLCRDGNF